MRLQTKPSTKMPNDNTTSLDWSDIGRLVRRRTLESVSTYFHSLAAVQSNADYELESHGVNRDAR